MKRTVWQPGMSHYLVLLDAVFSVHPDVQLLGPA